VVAVLGLLVSSITVGCVPAGDEVTEETVAPATTLSPVATAESMITGELARQIGLGPLTASCPDPGSLALGSTFGCTATTSTGAVIGIDASVAGDGHLALATNNLITVAALAGFEEAAASALNDEVGSTFAADAVDCGDGPVVLPSDQVLPCALTVASNGEVYDLTLTVTDLDERHFGLVVADQPRPG
jgi:hypothetical protein